MRVVGKQAMTDIVRQRRAFARAGHPAACRRRDGGARKRRSAMASSGIQLTAPTLTRFPPPCAPTATAMRLWRSVTATRRTCPARGRRTGRSRRRCTSQLSWHAKAGRAAPGMGTARPAFLGFTLPSFGRAVKLSRGNSSYGAVRRVPAERARQPPRRQLPRGRLLRPELGTRKGGPPASSCQHRKGREDRPASEGTPGRSGPACVRLHLLCRGLSRRPGRPGSARAGSASRGRN
jgi:hypothetical protein